MLKQLHILGMIGFFVRLSLAITSLTISANTYAQMTFIFGSEFPMPVLEERCARRDAPSCAEAGSGYYNGYSVTRDPFKARDLLSKACDIQAPNGCVLLGKMYADGYGVRLDWTKALTLFKKGCDNGDALGCLNLGVAHERGEGTSVNKQKALEFFGRACDMRREDGCQEYARIMRPAR
jgi:TPR repeat protein